MKLRDLFLSESVADDIKRLTEALKNLKPLKLFVIAHVTGVGIVHTIEQEVPNIKTIILHEHVDSERIVKFLKDNEGYPIHFDVLDTRKLTLEQENIIKAAFDGKASYRSANVSIESKVDKNIVVSMRSIVYDQLSGRPILDRGHILHIGGNKKDT